MPIFYDHPKKCVFPDHEQIHTFAVRRCFTTRWRATITDTWPSFSMATKSPNPRTRLCRPTNVPRLAPWKTCRRRIPSVWVWPSTSPCSTLRFSIHRSGRAALQSRCASSLVCWFNSAVYKTVRRTARCRCSGVLHTLCQNFQQGANNVVLSTDCSNPE